MDDLKLIVGLDGSVWVSHADDVDAVPAGNGVFVYHMGKLVEAVNEVVTQKTEHRYTKVSKRVKPIPPIPQPPPGRRP